ncbi:MAG: hypothetical protein SA378_01155 [Sedimentibacter sp.]|uniref:hypothetical protein n=1 Tax=Sedimentibacter sp. TaxID=1960295 RepID=UPI0029811FAD|nr:hypothetical protein [Sedimentibacter sp.]MDW5298739.1 hypothetical protein [Sedimentibacter sp.]
MTYNLLDIFTLFFNSIGEIISNFTTTKTTLDGVVTNLTTFDMITIISPYVGTIRYVVGDTIYNMTIRLVQVSLFIGLIKAAYQLVHMLTNSSLIKKPTALIKSFLGL